MKFFKTKDNRNLFKINNVLGKIKQINHYLLKENVLNKINYDNLIDNFT